MAKQLENELDKIKDEIENHSTKFDLKLILKPGYTFKVISALKEDSRINTDYIEEQLFMLNTLAILTETGKAALYTTLAYGIVSTFIN